MARRQGFGLFIAFNRLLRCRRGVGSVEFAILAPILISLYICCFELTMGLSTAKRVTRSAATVADLVTQQSSVSKSFLATMQDVTQAIFVPYDAGSVSLKITGIAIDHSATAKVLWSWQDGSRPYGAGTVVNDVPDDMKTADSFLVRAELSVPHTLLLFLPGLLSTDSRSITISRTYYYRQRVGDGIACSDC